MKEALEQVVELFRAKDWKFEVDEDNDLVRTGIEGDNGHWQVNYSGILGGVALWREG